MFNFLFNKKGLISKFNPLVFNSKTVFFKNEKYFFEDLKKEYLDVNHENYLIFSRYSNVCLNHDKNFYDDLNFQNCIFEITPHIFGREFSKTCSFRLSKYGEYKPCLFEVLSGDGFFILEDSSMGDVKIIKVSKGDYVLIEDRFSFVLVNSSEKNNLTLFSIYTSDSRFEENVLENFNGANLYYTTQGFIKNMNSKHSYNLENLQGDYITNYSFDKQKTLYENVLLSCEKFNFLK